MHIVRQVNLKAGEAVLLCPAADGASRGEEGAADRFWIIEVEDDDVSFPIDDDEPLAVRALVACERCLERRIKSGGAFSFESGGHLVATRDRTFP